METVSSRFDPNIFLEKEQEPLLTNSFNIYDSLMYFQSSDKGFKGNWIFNRCQFCLTTQGSDYL